MPSAFCLGTVIRKRLSISLSVKSHIKTQSKHISEQGVARDLLRCFPPPFHVQKPTLCYKQQEPSNWLVNPIWKLIPEVEGASRNHGSSSAVPEALDTTAGVLGNNQTCVGCYWGFSATAFLETLSGPSGCPVPC